MFKLCTFVSLVLLAVKYVELKRGCDLSDFNKGIIYGLKFYAHWTHQQIADQLAIPKTTVDSYCARAKNMENNLASNRALCGCKRKASMNTDRQIKRTCLQNPFATAKEIKNSVAGGEHLSDQTIRNRLDEAGLGCHIAATKTQLSQEHIKARFEWAKDKLHWTFENNWKSVIFSDESRFDLGNRGLLGLDDLLEAGIRGNMSEINKISHSHMLWFGELSVMTDIPS